MKPRAIIVDLDNCISDDRARIPLIHWCKDDPDERYEDYHEACDEDPVSLENVEKIRKAAFQKNFGPITFIFLSARPEAYSVKTYEWTGRHLSKAFPGAWVYKLRPDGDKRPSVVLKKEVASILSIDYDIVAAFDDREDIVAMYNELGLNGQLLKIHDETAYSPQEALAVKIRKMFEPIIEEAMGQISTWFTRESGLPPEQEIKLDVKFPKGIYKPTDPTDDFWRNPLPSFGCVKFPIENDSTEVPSILEQAAATFRERNAVYGSNYQMVGPIMAILFPAGVPNDLLKNDAFHLFELMIVKLSRLAISELTHRDSAHDAAVYAAMIESIIANKKEE